MNKVWPVVRCAVEGILGLYLMAYALLLGLPKGIAAILHHNIAYGLGTLAGVLIVGTLSSYLLRDAIRVGSRLRSKSNLG